MIRGIRSVGDFEYERAIAQINQTMMPEVETIFILSKPEYSAISSTIVRDILRNNGDISKFLPQEALPFIKRFRLQAPGLQNIQNRWISVCNDRLKFSAAKPAGPGDSFLFLRDKFRFALNRHAVPVCFL